MILNIFSPKFGENIGVFALTTAGFRQKIDHNLGFVEKRQVIRRKLAKVAENCDHTIDLSLSNDKMLKKLLKMSDVSDPF
jgi:hypothetical protein